MTNCVHMLVYIVVNAVTTTTASAATTDSYNQCPQGLQRRLGFLGPVWVLQKINKLLFLLRIDLLSCV
jgi:hypothetical protein